MNEKIMIIIVVVLILTVVLCIGLTTIPIKYKEVHTGVVESVSIGHNSSSVVIGDTLYDSPIISNTISSGDSISFTLGKYRFSDTLWSIKILSKNGKVIR